MAISKKLYRCTNCNTETYLETNHFGSCHPGCKSCNSHMAHHVCIEPEALEKALAAEFTKVRLVKFSGADGLAAAEKLLGKKASRTLHIQRRQADEGETWVKTAQLADDQFWVHESSPTNSGRHLFDFEVVVRYEGVNGQREVVQDGYYIVEAEELQALREKRFICRYCGHQDENQGICKKCINSEYLEESNLPLLVKVSIPTRYKKRPPISDVQKAELLEMWANRKTK